MIKQDLDKWNNNYFNLDILYWNHIRLYTVLLQKLLDVAERNFPSAPLL